MNSMRKELDAAMANVVLGTEKRAAILEAMEKGERPVKRVIRPMVVLAAVLALLTVSAFAVVPSLRELWTRALGGFSLYTAEVEGVSAYDQGIEIRVVSAMTDATNTRIYLEVQDKTGDRLKDSDIRLRFGVTRPEAEGMLSGLGSKCLSYDPETKTALFELTHDSTVPVTGDDMASIGISKIQPGYHNFWLDLPQELLTDQLLETQKIDSGETVLKPGQTPYTFEGEKYLSLSSMGFASDGRIHFLLELDKNVEWDISDDLGAAILTNLGSKSGTGHWGEEGIETKSFWLNNRLYHEISFPLTTDAFPDLLLDEVYGKVVTQPVIEGAWRLEVKLEQVRQRSFTINENIGGITYHNITLSPMVLTMRGNPPSDGIVGYISHLPIAVLMKDGTVLRPDSRSGSYLSSGLVADEPDGDRSLDRWEFDTPPDVDQVIGIAVGYWMIPINGDTAGPGYWLSEMP